MPTYKPKYQGETCPSGYGFTRENGTRCYGGTHGLGGTAAGAGANADGSAVSQAVNNKSSEGHCKHGYRYNREEGTRCYGGTHYVGQAQDEKFAGRKDKDQENQRLGVKVGPGHCKHGYSYNREEGTRCNGGTHYLNSGDDEAKGADGQGSGNGGLSGQWWKRGAGNCRHGYAYSREQGTRCKGGSHYIGAGEGENADGSGAGNGSRDGSGNGTGNGSGNGGVYQGNAAVCKHGYAYNREQGTRCKGGTHFLGAPEDEVFNSKEKQKQRKAARRGPGVCKHGYGYSREDGKRCKGGSHYIK